MQDFPNKFLRIPRIRLAIPPVRARHVPVGPHARGRVIRIHVVALVQRRERGGLIDGLLDARPVVVLDDDAIGYVEIKGHERLVLRIFAQPLPPVDAGAAHGTCRVAQPGVLAGNRLAVGDLAAGAKGRVARHVLVGGAVAGLAVQQPELGLDVDLRHVGAHSPALGHALPRREAHGGIGRKARLAVDLGRGQDVVGRPDGLLEVLLVGAIVPVESCKAHL